MGPVLMDHRRALRFSLLSLAGAAGTSVLVGLPATRPAVQAVDDAVLGLVEHVQVQPLLALAEGLSLLGAGWVTWPVRLAAAVLLAVRRRWLHLTALVLTVVTSEAAIGPGKALFDRPRPPGGLVETTGASFPSGHAVAAAVTAVVLVLVLLPPGRARFRWEVRAASFACVMALSRVYLDAHWLSDVVAGGLLGAGLAVGWPALLQAVLQRPDDSQARPAAPAAAAG